MATSILQTETKERLRAILSGFEVYENYRPNWMRNPDTGKNLELDFYIPEVKIAIEVQGAQHFQYTPGFHACEDDFVRQQKRDQQKKLICASKDIQLFEIITFEDIDKFIDAVMTTNREFGYILHEKSTALRSLEYYKAEFIRETRKPLRKQAQSKLDHITERMIHIIQKYNFDPHKINADFQLTKHELQYSGKKKVYLNRLVSAGSKPKPAILMRTNGNTALIRCFVTNEKDTTRDYIFDLSTGEQLSGEHKSYTLRLDSLQGQETW